MLDVLLFPSELHLNIQQIEKAETTVTISIFCTTKTAPCPECGIESDRIHSIYHRIPKTYRWSAMWYGCALGCAGFSGTIEAVGDGPLRSVSRSFWQSRRGEPADYWHSSKPCLCSRG